MTKTLRNLCVLMTIMLWPMAVMAQTIYVDLKGGGDGSSWGNATTLDDALNNKATAGSVIWMRGYETMSSENVYRVPVGGLTVKSGVSIYGGFSGNEKSLNDREVVGNKAYRMKFSTVISGDVKGDDETVNTTNLIFPFTGDNYKRGDNAQHVLTLNLSRNSSNNTNSKPTVINGVTIARGNADNSNGGGIFVKADDGDYVAYRIEKCFFIENYAQQGGALYVDASVANNPNECLIDRCGFFNNAAGTRGVAENHGGAIYLAGAGTVVNSAIFNNENGGIYLNNNNAQVINSTVTRNTASGIDGKDRTVVNTVIWGNSTLSSSDNAKPNFRYCAYPEANAEGERETNVYLAAKNNEENGPHFSSPSIKTGFDTSFDITNKYPLWTWEPMEATPLVDKGDNGSFTSLGLDDKDLNNDTRIQGVAIDIGAFEYQPVAAGRIRYVRRGGTGDGISWENASGDIQRMIDDLADNNPQNLPGEVWVAAGEYEPQTQLITGTSYSASFRMRDGISVYGGFSADYPEDSKTERVQKKKGSGETVMPWEFENETVLRAAYYIRSESNPTFINNKWMLTSDSRHVVWFAPMRTTGDDGSTYGFEADFTMPTYLDGVTIMGGYAQGDTGQDEFLTDRGAGVYMHGRNTYLANCVVKENYATGNGGGVYVSGGRVQSSLIYNNNSDQNGGAVYVDDEGMVHRSMLANNSARNGAGAYLYNNTTPQDGEQEDHPEYLILSTCVVSNNTASGNGAVYCDNGGVLLQNTITNNQCVTSTDLTDPNASQTGGIYINSYALVANSVIWNNRMGTGDAPLNIPMYAKNPTAANVRFMYNAISGVNNAVWNNTLQQQTLSLVDENEGTAGDSNSIGPRFEDDNLNGFNLDTSFGVQSDWKDGDDNKSVVIDYFWKPIDGSNLWARGMALGQLPSEVVLAPEIDIEGQLFAQKPAVGAFHVNKSNIVPALENGNTLVVYIDADCTEPDHHGSSWATAYRSLNDAISFFAGLSSGSEITIGDGTEGGNKTYNFNGNENFEIRVLEGNLWPRYAFVNEDPKTATLDILAMQSGKQLRIVGGYYRTTDSNTAERDPLNHRSQLNGNPEGKNIEDGLYHVVTVESGANVMLDGFHIINGYAAGTATLQYGAGMLIHSDAAVTVANTIFENNTAVSGAAIYADPSATLTLQNCVVNNNTNTVDVKNNAIINSYAGYTNLQHVTIVNNAGAAVVDESLLSGSSFSKGNDAKNSIDGELETIGAKGAANFVNPTNYKGAQLGFDTYFGGYSSFRPLTSSSATANLIINKVSTATTLAKDIMGNERNLGGTPDLGAYEADLPKAGKVIYVRSYNEDWDGDNGNREESDGNPSMDLSTAGDGSSWDKAINGNAICDLKNEHNDTDAGFYIVSSNKLQLSSRENEEYVTGDYRPTSGSYGNFWDAVGNDDDQVHGSGWNRYSYNKISNNRDEQYISGLQYAVEKAAEANAKLAEGEEPVEVWVGAGIYTDYKGFVIREGVKVLGGFPVDGRIPGENERHPLLSDYIPANGVDASLPKRDYETILQIRKETPVTWNGYNPTKTSTFNDLSGTQRHYVLYQPDECIPTWNISGDERNKRTGANQYRYRYAGNSYADEQNDYKEYEEPTIWDGFTVRHGYIKNYYSNRDGGAGVRVFRGVTLQNLVIVNNCNDNGNRNRGGGLYMDGDNSRINNSFILNNYLGNVKESMGGGAYIIVGTGYNLVVANNYCSYSGGGIFLENATFFNNTIAYNYAPVYDPSSNQGGSGMYHYSGGAPSSHLELYNCIFYGNSSDAYQIRSSSPNNFTQAYNCYVAGNIQDNLNGKFLTNSPYNNQISNSLPNPFADSNAQNSNNYRLAPLIQSNTNTCVNRGTESIEQNGDIINLNLPSTDMDYTNRIKDCTVDIGAYERDNEDTTRPDGNGVYYVTWTGFGNASADSPKNAACADKLQTVLKAAGERAKSGDNAVVKIAGYKKEDEFVYHANTLANSNNPQSYTFVVPVGVTVKGGYFEGTFENGVYQGDGWSDDDRDAMTYRTVLSAEAVPTQGSTITQNVTGYHAVTFGGGDGVAAMDKPAVIDGLWLVDGSATSMAGSGNSDTRGGGAIVPSGAHVRNCVVMGNSAVEGGGLYVLPGGTVSGTLVRSNTADNGGGIYADNGGTDSGNEGKRAHIISCTIADNTASADGGGLYLEDGASMQVNTVIWGNVAPSNKNVSGVTSSRYIDTRLTEVFGNMNNEGFYPFNDCFIESQEMPSDFENASMESDSTMYFIDMYRRLKEFSPLIKHGVADSYQDALQKTFHVADNDMQNIKRNQGMGRLDAGAFAYDGGILPDDLFTRIFVSQTTNVKLQDKEDMLKYLGKSFYTSFSTLEDALAYIRKMRGESGKADNDTHFEILVGGGTYKPTYMRGGDDVSPAVTHDQRLYSFVIPQNVSIYGGFSGTENYTAPQFDEGKIPAEPDDIIVDNRKSIDDILNDRNSNDKDYYSDFNKNNIKEPWELANQTILSGNINASSDAKNAYHVVFSNEEGATQPVVLDGLTIMDGETYNDMTDVANHDEAGRGGGLYSNGVPYTINRCRFINNFGVRGGAVYMRDARLNVIGSIFAGNGTVDNPQEDVEHQKPRGGAIFLAGLSSKNAYASLYAVNSLFVNNETAGEGGVIGTNYAESVVTNYDPMIDIMNCTFAKNKAQTNAVIYNHNGKSKLTNTLIWGNESETYNENTDAEHLIISHSASDYNYGKKFGNGEVGSTNDDNNILLDKNNTGTYGPRFTRPATEAGAGGNNANNLWNPSAISVVTDKGDGVDAIDGGISGAYNDWFNNSLDYYRDQYMGQGYDRYSGPLDENTGKTGDKPIDIGVYEYQYVSNFQYMYAIYVATDEGEGDGSGLNWNNPTSDLRGAIVGASHPLGDSADRTIYVRDGVYELDRLSGGTAFIADLSSSELSDGLTIKGSCTGVGLGDDAQQNFANQSVIRSYEGTQTKSLLDVRANYDKYVTIEGFTFINESGTGIDASTSNNLNSKFTLANSALRINKTGVNISNSGSVLIYNTLFADGGTGLNVTSGDNNVMLVNTTFANNETDMSNALTKVYNSVSWNNVTQNMPSNDVLYNKVFQENTENSDVLTGPNFVDPENGDYRIRPSLTLLNRGNDELYLKNVSIGSFDNEYELSNAKRKIDTSIDIGAYECEAVLQPIIYVRDKRDSDNSGSSWDNPIQMENLQDAIDLAGLYANDVSHKDENAYVFVDRAGVSTHDLNVSLGNTKVYGGMNLETSEETETSEIVKDLLTMRSGLLESNSYSTLTGKLTIGSATATEPSNSVVDGFLVNSEPTINNGYLSTSIVTGNVGGTYQGMIYNSLVTGDVNNVKAVNVTAMGDISEVNGSANNREGVTEINKYVTEGYWKYQLNETDKDNIDVNEKDEETRACQDMVGHNRDIAGNLRIRNNVDNGCFETWNITADVSVTDDDYPHGQSVVYVRNNGVDNEGAELTLERKYTASNPFNPGVLLLEHRAGLRVVGNGEQDNEKYGADGNNVGLSYVIVERDVKDGSANMSYIPFRAEVENDGVVKLKRYDASKRAEYGYTLSDGGDGAWTDFGDAIYDGSYGLLLDNTAGSELQHVRFVGKGGSRTDYVYLEGKGMNAKKQVSLKSENHSDPWTTANPSTGHKFTAKENMSWNLFGSPYLCAMNYEDMEYGRVIYGYENDGYLTVNTDNADGETNISEGHIPAGDAIFTQTATLKEYETFDVYPRTGDKSGEPYASMSPLKLSIASTGETRAAGDGDVLQLNAVAPEMSRTDFDMGADGVKWMADGVAQIYAVQGGGRYSLLSAVNIDGKVSVGVTLPEAGMYTIAVPDDCLADDYESVILEDAANGRKTNLLEGGYDFTSTTAGDIEGRFSISFNRMIDDRLDDGIRAYSIGGSLIRVEGVEPDDRIMVYSADGMSVASHVAASSVEDVRASAAAVAVVKVVRGGQTVAVRKIKVS